MKNLIKPNHFTSLGSGLFALLTIAAISWGTIGCEKQDLDRTFEGPYFVRFTDSTLIYKESYTKPITIRVHNAGPQLDQPITVNYVISGSAREGKDYTIVGTKGTVIIPAKKSSGEITLKLINNANNILESQNITFTLTSVQPSTLKVGFGNEGVLGKQMKFVIQDDCLFGGFYTGTSRVGTQNISVPNIEITSIDCKDYLLSNWNLGVFSFNAVRSTLRFRDNGDNSITIPSQSNSEFASTDSLSGNGAWNPRDRKITLNVRAKIRINTYVRDSIVSFRDTTLVFAQTYTPQ